MRPPPHPRDEAWFEELFRSHGNRVLAYARRRVPDDADDVLSEVFTTAWRHRATLPDPPLLWLYRTAGHQVLHVHRGHGRRAALAARAAVVDEPDRQPVDPLDGLAARLDDRDAVHALLGRLPAADAELLRLWAWEELDAADIAYVLGCSAAAARVRLHRARRRARTLLDDDTPVAAADADASHLQPPPRPVLIEERS